MWVGIPLTKYALRYASGKRTHCPHGMQPSLDHCGAPGALDNGVPALLHNFAFRPSLDNGGAGSPARRAILLMARRGNKAG